MWTWYQSSYWKFPAIVQEMLPEQHNVLLLIMCSSQRGENFHKPYPSKVLALSMRISQGHLFLLYFLEGPSKGIHTFPKMPSTDWGPCPCSGIGQRNPYPPVVHPTTDCHAYCWALYVLLSHWAAQVEQFCTWKGWKNWSLESFVLQGSQQMALRGAFAWFHYSSTAGWAAGQQGMDGMARKLPMRTEAL